jgi:hypothetical protein
MEAFSSDAEVTGDIKANGLPLKVTTTFSPLETVRIALPVWFLRSLAVIVLIVSSLNSYLINIIAIWELKGKSFILSSRQWQVRSSLGRPSQNGAMHKN